MILAGGKSTRMGSDKAFARIGPQTLVERCAGVMARCFTTTIIIANRPEAFESLRLSVRKDDLPDLGPLGGILTALHHAATPAVFIIACDMPFLNDTLIRAMAESLAGYDAVAPRIASRFEPLHAAYHRRILPVVEARIQAGDCSVSRLLEAIRTRPFAEAELAPFVDWKRTFLNVNTPEELAKAKKMSE